MAPLKVLSDKYELYNFKNLLLSIADSYTKVIFAFLLQENTKELTELNTCNCNPWKTTISSTFYIKWVPLSIGALPFLREGFLVVGCFLKT